MNNVREQLKIDEGLRLKVYKCTANKLTIGYGRNVEGAGVSLAEAELMLGNDITKVTEALERAGLLGDEHSDARKGVFINMAFQLGVSGFLGFKKTIKSYMAGDYDTCAAQMLESKWARKDTPARALRLSIQMKTGEWQ